jgi:predicted transcriptional regulator
LDVERERIPEMTTLLEMAIEAVAELPAEQQDEITKAIFEFVNARSEPYVLSDAEREAIEESRRQADRGEFATDEQVRAVLSKYSQ